MAARTWWLTLTLLTLLLATSTASARDRYYKYVARSSALRVGDRVRPGFVHEALKQPRRAGFERMLERTRRDLIRAGDLSQSTPSRTTSVFAGLRRTTWKGFLRDAKLIRVAPLDPSAVVTLDHNHLDRAWSAWQKASHTTGSTSAKWNAEARAGAVRYWTTPPSGTGKSEVLLGGGATVVKAR